MNARPPENPGLVRYVAQGWRDEAFAIGLLLRREWPWALLLLALIAAGVAALDPLPEKRLRIAKGQPNSGLEVMALAYRDALREHGVALEFVDSGGAPDSLEMVAARRADVGLSQSGLPAPGPVVYLGSVAYQPLWLFHRITGSEDQGLADFLVGRQVSVGGPASGSRAMSELLLAELPEDVRIRIRERELDNARTLNGMRDGAIEAAFLLATFESRNTQTLLADPTIGLYDFAAARGLSFRLGFTEPVTLPAGAISQYPLRPSRDIRMVATTMTLVARPDLHPATQRLLLTVSRSIAQRARDPFSGERAFPAFVDRELPRSPIAERFHRQGPPALSGRVPYWVASLVDSLWVAVLALLAVVYPLARFMPSYRRLTFDALVSRRYRAAREIESDIAGVPDFGRLLECGRRLETLTREARSMWIPNGCSGSHAALLTTLLQIERKLRTRISEAAGDAAPVQGVTAASVPRTADPTIDRAAGPGG